MRFLVRFICQFKVDGRSWFFVVQKLDYGLWVCLTKKDGIALQVYDNAAVWLQESCRSRQPGGL